jgi:hypothetical protein
MQVNPTEIKVVIISIKPLRDVRIIIEAGSKNEIENLGEQIGEKCGQELEVKIRRLRNPKTSNAWYSRENNNAKC